MKNELGIKIVKRFSLDKKLGNFSKQKAIENDLAILHNGTTGKKELYQLYLSKKVQAMLLAMLGMTILLMFIWLFFPKETELVKNTIIRNGYGESEKSLNLIAESEGMEREIIINIDSRHYSKEQLDVFAKEVFEILPKIYFQSKKVTGEGTYIIDCHMQLPSKIEGYPFDISWNSTDYEVLDSDGRIMLQKNSNPKEVILTAGLSCYDYVWEQEYVFMVYRVAENWETNFEKRVEEEIEELDYLSASEEEFILPSEIDGHAISYQEKSEDKIVMLAGFGVLVICILWILPDNNLANQIKQRNKQLSEDYPKLVGKLTLYMGAGLSFRTAITKIAKCAEKNRFYTRELEIVIRELENGISEQKAISNMADRCKISSYVKLSVLLNQNIRKGSSSLSKQLKEELNEAFEDRKNLARKYGEEAGTKILFPMIMMLMVVIVMIMYPAFVSFTV